MRPILTLPTKKRKKIINQIFAFSCCAKYSSRNLSFSFAPMIVRNQVGTSLMAPYCVTTKKKKNRITNEV